MGIDEQPDDGLQQQLSKLIARLNEAHFEREKLARSERELQTRIDELSFQVSRLSSELSQILNSTSWRVTGPLRIAARRLPILGRLSRRFVARGAKLFHRMEGRAEPTISRSSLRNRDNAQLVGPSAPSGEVSTKTDAFTKFIAVQGRPGRMLGLVAAEYPPMFDKDYAALRSFNLIRVLCQLDRRLVFISRKTRDQFTAIAGSNEERERYEDLLYEAGIEHIAYGTDAEPMLRAFSAKLNWCYIASPSVGDDVIPLVRLHAPWAAILYDMSNYPTLRAGHYGEELEQAQKRDAYAKQIGALEFINARIADMVIVAAEHERRELVRLDRDLLIEVIPSPFYVPTFLEHDISKRTGVVFLCRCWDADNIDGLTWFVSDVWPLIRAKRPNVIFRIVGNTPPPSTHALYRQAGINSLETAPSVSDVFTHCRVSVVPLRSTVWLEDRVGESLANGLPVVARSVASEGPLRRDKDLLIADTPAEFAHEVLRLLDEDDLWSQFEANGRRSMQKQAEFALEKLRAFTNG